MKVLTKKDTTNQMMKFAWRLEYILCLTGVLIAFSLNYNGATGGSSEPLSLSSWMIIITSSLPLLAIALAELFKIPFVTGFLYMNSYLGKAIALIGLIGVCWLTFENLSAGLTQGQDLSNRQIEIGKRTENALTDKISLKDGQIVALETLSPEDIRKNGNEGIQDQLNTINLEIDNLKESREVLAKTMNPAEVSELKRQIASLEASKQTIELDNRANLKDLNIELKQLNRDEQIELADSNFRKGRIKEQYEVRREGVKKEKIVLAQDYKKDIERTNKKITTLNNKVINLSQPNEQLLGQLNSLDSQISKAEKERGEIRKNANNQIDASVLAAQNSDIRINELNIERVQLVEELNQTREAIANNSSHSFIYSLAGKFHQVDNLADLKAEQVSTFALIFMTTIAAIISMIGPIMTFIAYKIHLETEAPKKSKLVPAMRAALIDLRRKLRNPKIVIQIEEIEVEKEVIKEVPVEKVVYETVIKREPFEVPVYVQVPVPTDARDFPEMADLKDTNVTSIMSSGGVQ